MSSYLFFEDFTGNSGLEHFEWGVYHRNAGWQIAGQPLQSTGWDNALHGGSWTGDHDLSGGPPSSQRDLASQNLSGANFDFNVEELTYTARDHLMTSMGDVDGYSVVWFSPEQTFDAVGEVTFDVNLTDLGTRQWIKVGVVSEAVYDALGKGGVFAENTAPAHLRSDVGASNLNGSLQDDGVLIASWSGGASAGYPGGLKIGNGDERAFSNPTPTDKMTRHQVSLKDNGDGTITFTVAGVSITEAGSFPDGPVRVVFYDHNYTPEKSESGAPSGFTWHWDNIGVHAPGSTTTTLPQDPLDPPPTAPSQDPLDPPPTAPPQDPLDPNPLDTLFDANPDIPKGLAAAYQVLLDGVPNQAGFTSLINNAVPTNFGAGPGVVFNAENIFINLANSLVQGNPTAATKFGTLAPGATLQEQVTALYNAIIPAASQTADGLAFLTRPDGLAFYQAVAAERGVAGPEGAAIVAMASLLQIAVTQDIGVGDNVNDLIMAVNAASAQIPAAGNVFTDINVADGTAFDGDDVTTVVSAFTLADAPLDGAYPEISVVGSHDNPTHDLFYV